MKNCSIFLGLVLLTGCANLQWFDELKGGERYSSGTRIYHTTDTYAYDAPAATTNYDRIDNAVILNVQKPVAKGDTRMTSAGAVPVVRIYKEGLHWVDNNGGYYIRQNAQLKDNEGVLYSENGPVWTPVK
jgi:hypothetical protein